LTERLHSSCRAGNAPHERASDDVARPTETNPLRRWRPHSWAGMKPKIRSPWAHQLAGDPMPQPGFPRVLPAEICEDHSVLMWTIRPSTASKRCVRRHRQGASCATVFAGAESPRCAGKLHVTPHAHQPGVWRLRAPDPSAPAHSGLPCLTTLLTPMLGAWRLTTNPLCWANPTIPARYVTSVGRMSFERSCREA
jgi:hypothetical protein